MQAFCGFCGGPVIFANKIYYSQFSVSTMMYMGWYGHKDDNYPVSIYKDGTNGNDYFIHGFKEYSEVNFSKLITFLIATLF